MMKTCAFLAVAAGVATGSPWAGQASKSAAFVGAPVGRSAPWGLGTRWASSTPTSTKARPGTMSRSARARLEALSMKLGEDEKVVLIGVAADSGCGKSTFMRRLTSIFGGDTVGPLGGGFDNGGWETNSLVSDLTTVLCLDDYHLNDRGGRKVSGRTALHTEEQKFDLMYEQLNDLKNGKSVMKPIYNHVNGTLDTPEEIKPTPIVIIEGLHPFVDKRVRDLLDFTIYLDISDEIKFAWKIQRDMMERGHSLESIQASIEARKPDFDAFIAPQRSEADVVIQVLPTQLIPGDTEGKILRTRMVQKEGLDFFDPAFLFDEGSTISWVPCGRKLTCSFPGIKFAYGPDTYYDNEVSVIEMDGQFDNLQELIYVESHLSNIGTKFYGELTQNILKQADSPGSNNGTGFLQTLVALKLREVYERITKKTVSVKLPESVAQ
ncbi:Phosphoribulokinase [Ectocarpus siliculosus]|uniref:Phosphoribulokinase n=1 Tax=Ectocarpus siliculosus TaxID=2880 RepID=D8LBI0_ECTSI|nr:Phosphoribulokinase [Ectocarpus siliculosus]|eukprot:CBN76689.1 Phosphoribulokinase [Ectocarpus siliculosus]